MISKSDKKKVKDCVNDTVRYGNNAPPDLVETLQGFIVNADTRNYTYECLIRRVKDEKKSQRIAVLCGIRVTNRYLSKYPPTGDVLAKLATFWETHQNESGAVGKTAERIVQYCVSRKKQIDSGAIDPSDDDNSSISSSTQELSSSVSKPSFVQRDSPQDRSSSPTIASSLFVRCHFTSSRGAKGMIPLPGSVNLLHLPAIGSQFRRTGANIPGTKTLDIDRSDSLSFADIAGAEVGDEQPGVRVVAAEKKKREVQEYSKTQKLRMSRSPVLKLLNYKYYSEQSPLKLSEEEMKHIFDTVVCGSRDEEFYKTACKVAIKVFMDLFVEGGIEAFQGCLTLLLEMLRAADGNTRKQAFTMLVNISIHSNLFEANHASGPGVISLQTCLREWFLPKMLNTILYRREKEASVWVAGLNCFCFLSVPLADRVLKTSIVGIDPRVFFGFFENVPFLSDATQRLLWRCVVESLYSTSSGELDVDKMEARVPLSVIVTALCDTRSTETRLNIFMVLYDYIIARKILPDKGKINGTVHNEQMYSIESIFEVLKQCSFANVLPQIIRHVPPRFVENCVNFILNDVLRPVNERIVESLDRGLLIEILTGFVDIINDYWKLDAEFVKAFDELLINDEAVDHEKAMLRVRRYLDQLLHSENDDDVRNGSVFLFELMNAAIERTDIWNPSAIRTFVNKTCLKLVHSSSARVRSAFVLITGRLIWLYKSRAEKATTEKQLNDIFQLLNTQFRRLTKIPEKNETNLLQMCDLVIEFVSIFSTSPPPIPNALATRFPDTTTESIIQGEYCLPFALVHKVDVQLFLHVLFQLPPRHYSQYRLLLVSLVMEKCRRSEGILQTSDGIALFKVFLNDKDPRVVFLALKFLLAFLKLASPALFSKYSKKLAGTAQAENPFVQVTVLLEIL